MVADSDDSYWRHEVMLDLEDSPSIPTSVLDGLRANAPWAPEALTLVLELELQKSLMSKPQPVASDGMPRSLISRGAVLALIAGAEAGVPPTPRLIGLIKRLLEIERPMRGSLQDLRALNYALLVKALVEDVTEAELAEEVEISRTTAGRWLRDPQFLRWAKRISRKKAVGVLSKPEADDVIQRIEDRRKSVRRGPPSKSRPRKN